MKAFSRRRFLAGAAVAAVSSSAGPFALGQEPARRLKAGFLGTAHSHFKEKHRVIEESRDFELIGLCEEDPAIRGKGPPNARWLSRESLLAEAQVVIVESAVADHYRHAKMALEAGRHVHVEKPPADTLAGFKELQAIAAAKNRRLQVGYMWRFNPGLNGALNAAREGWLGEVYLVRATMNTLVGAEARREWAGFRGGAMFEQGCHLIDPLIRLLGRPTQITPFLKHHGATADGLADNTIAIFEFPRAMGIVASAPLQPNAGPQRFFEVLGTNGTATVKPLEPPALVIDLGKAAGPYAAGRQEVKLPGYRRYVDEFVALAEAIREGKPLAVKPEADLLVQDAVLRACEMTNE